MIYTDRLIISGSILLLLALPASGEEELARFFCTAEKVVEVKGNHSERRTIKDKFTVYMLPQYTPNSELIGIYMIRTNLLVPLTGSFDGNRFAAEGSLEGGSEYRYALDIYRQTGVFLSLEAAEGRTTQTMGECKLKSDAGWISQVSFLKPPPEIPLFPAMLAK